MSDQFDFLKLKELKKSELGYPAQRCIIQKYLYFKHIFRQ